MTASPDIKIEIRDLTMAFDSFVVMRDLGIDTAFTLDADFVTEGSTVLP